MLKFGPWTLIDKLSPDEVVIVTVKGVPIDASAPMAKARGPIEVVLSSALVESDLVEVIASADSNLAAN